MVSIVKLAAHPAQPKREKEEEEESLMLQKARDLDAFDQQNHGVVPQYNGRNHSRDKNRFHGANSVKVTSYEEEALRRMKAFWLPLATPEAPIMNRLCWPVDHFEAADFKHLGSGSGLELVGPAGKT